MGKVFWEGIDSTVATARELTRIPRTCVMPVLRDHVTGVYNVAPYTAGLISVDPLILAVGVMGQGSQERIKHIDTFTMGMPSIDQTEYIWAAANRMPDGISELEVMGWHLLEREGLHAPGLEECRINLECKILERFKLPEPWRTVMIVRVTAICVNEELIGMEREEILKIIPVLEGGTSIPEGYYGVSTLSGGILSDACKAPKYTGPAPMNGKVLIREEDFGRYPQLRSLAVIPAPTYIVAVNDENGKPIAEVIEFGHLQASQPCLHVPFPRDSRVWARIREVGEFNIYMPTLENLKLVERLRAAPGTDPFALGFTKGGKNMFGIEVPAEIEVCTEADLMSYTEIEEIGVVFAVASKVGAVLEETIDAAADLAITHPARVAECINDFFSRLLFHAHDLDMRRVQVRYGKYSAVGFKTAPSWGNHLTVGLMHIGWLGVNAFHDWVLELTWTKILSKWEAEKIIHELDIWNDSKGIEYLRGDYPEGEMERRRERLTKLIRMMVWAHQDPWKWDGVHAYLETFPNPYLYRGHHMGPMHLPNWDITKEYI